MIVFSSRLYLDKERVIPILFMLFSSTASCTFLLKRQKLDRKQTLRMVQPKTPRRRVSFSEILQTKLDSSPERTQRDSSDQEDLGTALQYPWEMGEEFGGTGAEFAAALAAAAFAIQSLEETRLDHQRKMMDSFKDPSSQPRRTRSIGILSRRGSRTASSSTTLDDQRDSNYRSLSRRGSKGSFFFSGPGDFEISVRSDGKGAEETARPAMQWKRLSTADAWERDQLEKIEKRYKKMSSDIADWENQRKMKAKLKLERRKAEIERQKRMIFLDFQTKTDWVDNVGRGARSQLDEKKKKEQSMVKEKSRKIRSTGQLPVVKCFCFSC